MDTFVFQKKMLKRSVKIANARATFSKSMIDFAKFNFCNCKSITLAISGTLTFNILKWFHIFTGTCNFVK